MKKYNMLAYKKFAFEIYPDLKEGIFKSNKVYENEVEGFTKYEKFKKIHDSFVLHYDVYETIKPFFLKSFRQKTY